MTLDAATMGPVDVAVIGFTGDAFNGQVVPALRDLVENDTVRIIDLVFIRKAANGDTTVIEAMDPELDPVFAGFSDDQHDLLSEEDLSELAESLDPATAAMVVVWENRWAARLATVIRGSRGIPDRAGPHPARGCCSSGRSARRVESGAARRGPSEYPSARAPKRRHPMPRRMGRPGLVGTAARTAVVVGTASAVSGSMHNKQAQKAQAQAAQQQELANQAAASDAAQAAAAAPAEDESVAKVKQLADLHAQGVLSDEEFAAAKAKALGI